MTNFVGWFLIGVTIYTAFCGIIALVKYIKKKKQLKEDEKKHNQEGK